jgi:hypothetical protein
MSALVISIDEWRAAHGGPDDDLPPPAALRVVAAGERPGDAFRLEVFLARARAVMGEQRPALRLVR